MKLNLGSGSVLIEGWVNIDILPVADFIHDLTKPLPFQDDTIEFIYSEHFIEHITYEQAVKLLQECYRVLKPGGKIRIATPDLDYVIRAYQNNWKDQAWLQHDDYQFIKTKGMMLNYAMRAWGHQHIYNLEDLAMILMWHGFKHIQRCQIGEGSTIELCNLETRQDSTLIIEATK